MKKLFVSLLVFYIALLTYGCGVTTVQIPIMPEIPSVYVEEPTPSSSMFKPPVAMNLNFKEKDGKEIQVKDDVSVHVVSIVDHVDNEKYSTKIEGPNGQYYTYSLFPTMLVLEIENKTDHIVRLTRTIIHVEDENQVEYPLISSFNANKSRLANEVSKSFDDYMETSLSNLNTYAIENKYLDEYRATVYGSYKADYERFVKEMKEGHADPTKEGVSTSDQEPGRFWTGTGVQMQIDKYSPDTIYAQNAPLIKQKVYSASSQITSNTNQKRSNINRLKEKAYKQIMSIPDVGGVITLGEYPPISILPGRTKEIIAPISKRFKDEKIKSILVGVFDLPTKVDAAGNPTKRANFNFHMIAERI